MPEQTPRSTKNNILNSLPDEDYNRLLPHLKNVDLPLGKNLSSPYEAIQYVYFPDSAMASVVATTQQGQSIEAGVIGFEGMTGFDVLMGVDSTPNECMIQLPDGGMRITVANACQEFNLGGAFHKLALRYIHSFMMQISQTALCNRLHSTEQRLSRWLLMCHDRIEGDEIKLTHEFLGIMLGAYRPTVTTSAVVLQAEGYIKYYRGHITIIDRTGLEEFCCDCYEVVKQEYDRLLN